jgi:hypothetical protein
MRLYVLTTITEGKVERPVAVVDDEQIANEWAGVDKDNDWIPLDLNDLSLTALAEKSTSQFTPQTPDQRGEEAAKTQKNLQEANRLLEEALKKKNIRSSDKRAERMFKYDESSVQRKQSQEFLNGYLNSLGDRDPKIHDFLAYLEDQYRDKMLPAQYDRLEVNALVRYRQMFGPK